ncbi:DUF4189 domain-containing protein [Nocardia sp. XZ_19_385]|uniref:DUF4189 domain-containing protein n=1 Tax=Nocardia sp. XZ_19_385 TaxID=2769488 RepID=UPI001890561E|nr:DUF4189 domain-containing protein [Nocardia sp. XZ_19_385]
MSLSRKAALVAVATIALATAGAGAAQAEPGPDGSLYGSFALNERNGDSGWGANYPDWAASDARALEECGSADCVIVVRFQDECAAIAVNSDNEWIEGYGPTLRLAELTAIRNLGPLDPPFPNFGSAAPKTAEILISACAN